MAGGNIEAEQPIAEQPIEEPELDNLEPWLKKYINKPFKGIDEKTNPDGTPFTRAEAIEATRQQLRNHVYQRGPTLDFHNKTRPPKGLPLITTEEDDQQIIKILLSVARSMNQGSQPNP